MQIEVPQYVFEWQCTYGHFNPPGLEVCAQCATAKPTHLTNPTVTCSSCSAVTFVPYTNATKSIRTAIDSTKHAVITHVDLTKHIEYLFYLQSTPDIFHCEYCNSLLAVPTGPWACQNCTTENAEDSVLCSQCSQKKREQKIICGICRQSTFIPSTNFIDGIKSTIRDLFESSRKFLFYLYRRPYITCNRCQLNFILPSQGEGCTQIIAADVEQPLAIEASGISSVNADHEITDAVICPYCKNQVS
jgi:hypothetical protein